MPTRRTDLPQVQTMSLAGRPLLEGWLAFTDDGRYLLVHSADGWLQIWDVERQALAYEYDEHFVLGAGPGPGPERLTVFAQDRIAILEHRGQSWAVQEYPHSLPTQGDDPADPDVWVRSMAVGPNETVVATWRWVASVSTADPARLLGFHQLAANMATAAICVRRSEQGYYVSIAYEDFGSVHLSIPEPEVPFVTLPNGLPIDIEIPEPDLRFVTQHVDGRVINNLTLDPGAAQFCHWLDDRTATAILPLSGRRFAAVFHGPEGALEIRTLEAVNEKTRFCVAESGRAVIGLTAGRVSRWTRTNPTPTTVAVPGRGPGHGPIVARPSYEGERCMLLSNAQKDPLRGIAVDLERGRVIGLCPGHCGGLTPYTFSPGGRLFATVVTANTETDFPLSKDGTVVISDLGT